MKNEKSIVFRLLLFLIPGLWQYINGQREKAIKIFIGVAISVFLSLFAIGVLMYLFIWVYAIYDRYSISS